MILCNLINQFLANLAMRFNTTKFVKSIVDLCIPNFPEQNLPALFVYHNGSVVKKLLGESQIGNTNMKCEGNRADFDARLACVPLNLTRSPLFNP